MLAVPAVFAGVHYSQILIQKSVYFAIELNIPNQECYGVLVGSGFGDSAWLPILVPIVWFHSRILCFVSDGLLLEGLFRDGAGLKRVLSCLRILMQSTSGAIDVYLVRRPDEQMGMQNTAEGAGGKQPTSMAGVYSKQQKWGSLANHFSEFLFVTLSKI